MDGAREGFRTESARHCGADFAAPCRTTAEIWDLQPHRFRYWLAAVPDEHQDEEIVQWCEVHAKAKERAKGGERTISMDELTGVQAIQRKHPVLPMQPGHMLRREFEYIRHGTLSWFLNLDVVTGRIIEPIFQTNPHRGGCPRPSSMPDRQRSDRDQWHIMLDNLNIHQSESRVALDC